MLALLISPRLLIAMQATSIFSAVQTGPSEGAGGSTAKVRERRGSMLVSRIVRNSVSTFVVGFGRQDVRCDMRLFCTGRMTSSIVNNSIVNVLAETRAFHKANGLLRERCYSSQSVSTTFLNLIVRITRYRFLRSNVDKQVASEPCVH